MMSASRSRNRRDESGAVALMTALMVTGLFVIAAIVVDLGHAREMRRQAQTAADAAALAGMSALHASGTVDVGAAVGALKAYVAHNEFVHNEVAWASCTDPGRPAAYVVVGGTPCISVSPDASRLRVRLPVHELPASLAGVVGVDEIDISATAEASGGAVEAAPPCGLCVLGTGTHQFSGNGSITTTNTGMAFNGRVTTSGNADLEAIGGAVSIQQSWSRSGNASVVPTPTTGRPELPDPLAHLPMPFGTSGSTYFGKKSFSGNDTHCVLEPGRYSSISMSGNSHCELRPGLFIITGKLAVSGNATIDATSGVTLYFPCGTGGSPRACAVDGEKGGELSLSGNAPLKINAPTSGETQGLSIVAERGNTSVLSYAGNTGKAITGTVYAPSAELKVSGNAHETLESMLVVEEMSYSGNGTLELVWVREKNAPLVARRVHLAY